MAVPSESETAYISRRSRAELTFVVTGLVALACVFALASDHIFVLIDRWAVRPLPPPPPRTIPPPSVRTAVNLVDGKAAPWLGRWDLSPRGSPKPTSESLVIRPIADGIRITVDGVGTSGARARQDYTATYVTSRYFATAYREGNKTHARLRVQDGDWKGREFSVESDGKTITLSPPQHWRDAAYVAVAPNEIVGAPWTWRANYGRQK